MSQKYSFPEMESSPSARAHRLSILRKMAGLGYAAISKKYKIGYSTLRQWEKGQRNLSTNGAKLIVDAMKQEGIECTLPWLLHGSGEAPSYINQKDITVLPNASFLEQEIALFRSGHLNAIVLDIKDDAMYPFLVIGDQVGGICLDRDQFEKMDGKYCIIESKTHGQFCRWAQKIPHTDLFNFQCLNLSSKVKNPITLKADKIIKAAPIIRFWKQEC